MKFDVDRQRERVRATYDRVARQPADGYPFSTGLEYAAGVLGYPRDVLAALPRECTERFAGVGNPHRIARITAGATVLDHACGAGMDVLLAARAVAPAGRVIGVDITPAMREHATHAAVAAGLDGIVEILEGTFEDLPVQDGSVDFVISNGALRLAPNKARVLDEVYRVLKPGGRLLLADVVLEAGGRAETSRDVRQLELWLDDAVTVTELETLAVASGLTRLRLVHRFDSVGTGSGGRDSVPNVNAYSAGFLACKPGADKP